MNKNIAIIGAGPTGLIAAEFLGSAGYNVTIYDRMPSPARKFLMAGRGGLNLTHSEPLEKFITRYNETAKWLEPHIRTFPPEALRAWCDNLGQETFIGSSGRIFPKVMKAAPMLRAWLRKLETLGVQYKPQHFWQGFEGDALKFTNTGNEDILVKADATLLALGGASWPRLGSDGGWVKILENSGIEIATLKPANCGFNAAWSEFFSTRFAGTPLKPVALTHNKITHQGEIMITANGIEGGAVYAISANLREDIIKKGSTLLYLDLRPGISAEVLAQKLQVGLRGKQSFSTFLRKFGLSPVAINLLREANPYIKFNETSSTGLANLIKALPITLTGTTGIERAISTAGGITQNALDENFMLRNKPRIFAAGEMLNWEAPTGGYLLQACFSTGIAAANGIKNYLAAL